MTYGLQYPYGWKKSLCCYNRQGAKTRNVPIMEKTCKHLKSYLHRFHIEDNPEEYLFYIERKGIRSQMSIDNVEKFVARYGKKAQETSTDVPEHLYPHIVETFTCDAFV